MRSRLPVPLPPMLTALAGAPGAPRASVLEDILIAQDPAAVPQQPAIPPPQAVS